MIQEAINKIEDLVRRAYGAEILSNPHFPRHIIVREGDQLEFRDTPPPMLRQAVTSLASLCAIGESSINDQAQYWVSRSHVIALLDPADPREWVAMSLYATSAWKIVRDLERNRNPGKGFSPRECLRLFRYDLGEGCNVDMATAGALSAMDFKTMIGVQRGATRERDTFGNQVDKEVLSKTPIPESTTLRVPMFNNIGLGNVVGNVTLDIIVDLEKEVVRLVPKPDHVAIAELQACEAVLQLIRERNGVAPGANANYVVGTPVVSIEGLPGAES